jgi:hypothetical protein
MRYTFVIALICVFVLGLVVGWHLGNDTRAPAQIVYNLSDTSSALTYYIASDMTRVVELSAGKMNSFDGSYCRTKALFRIERAEQLALV